VVIQIGKWRRQLVVANVPACADTPITNPDLTRLPRNKTEGDIPKFAIATGGSDALECLLRKIGVDEAEFTSDTGAGRVHLFQGYRASPTIATNGASSSLKSVDQLWSSAASMMRYDIVLMACEGDSGQSEGRTAAEYQAVRGYGDMGGRVFGSHYHTNWVRSEDGEPNAATGWSTSARRPRRASWRSTAPSTWSTPPCPACHSSGCTAWTPPRRRTPCSISPSPRRWARKSAAG
jgi:hypothetical protein